MNSNVRRLTKQKDFKRVATKGRFYNGRFIFLKKTINNLPVSRLAIVISTKVAKKAVVRNKLRRRIKEIIRRQVSEIKAGQDILIITKSGSTELKYPDLIKELINLFKKASLC